MSRNIKSTSSQKAKLKLQKVSEIKKAIISEGTKSLWTIPNFLTFLRIILAPVFVFTLFNNYYWTALFVLIFAGITDLLDGWTARKFGMQSVFGEALDPIADVILMFCVLISLLIKFEFPLWFAVIILLRDSVIIIGGIAFAIFGEFQLAKGHKLGKLSRFFQIMTILMYIILKVTGYLNQHLLWITVLMCATAILTAISIGIYLAQGYNLVRLVRKK